MGMAGKYDCLKLSMILDFYRDLDFEFLLCLKYFLNLSNFEMKCVMCAVFLPKFRFCRKINCQ